MQKIKVILFLVALIMGFSGCKTLAKGAAKWWTKKQVKEFVENCEEKTARLYGAEKAEKFCNCAVDKVAEEYKDFDQVKEKGILTVLKIASGCR